MEGLFKIIPIEGKGIGWVALQDIKVGTLILSEKCQFEPKIQNNLWSLMESFFSMTTVDQNDFLKLSNLFWENSEFLESRKDDYDNWMAFANHYSTQHSPKNPEVDGELVLKIICIFESNKSLGDRVGESVAIKNSMINHSCCANAFSVKRNGSMEVRATRKIKEGQEITTNYDLHWQCVMQKRKRRQEVIRAEYGFTCRCELCQNEELNDDEESYERFRKITENKEILNNIIQFETETMEKSPREFKKSNYSEILESIEKRHYYFTELYNLARNKKVPKDYILDILEGFVQSLYFGVKISKQAEQDHSYLGQQQDNLFIDKMKYFEEKARILVKIGLEIAKMCYGNDSVMAAIWNNRVETLINNLKRSQTFPRSATPVPPTGLNFGDFVEDFEMMDGRNSILDLANAPPLFQDQVEMDVMPSGEKRKTTPPDLLTLSNMYFERKQKNLDRSSGTTFPNSRNLESSASSILKSPPGSAISRDFCLDRHNLGLVRPRKLTPLERLPRSSQIRIEDQEGGRGGRLHLPVHYNKTNAETIGGAGWKQTLDPIVQKDEKYPRKEETFTIYSPDTTDTESNDNMEIF